MFYTQIVASIMVGLGVSALAFLPLVVWQYRRYGRFDAVRMLWTSAGFVYATAIVALTVFPMPEFAPGYCESKTMTVSADPTRWIGDVYHRFQAVGLSAFTEWLFLEGLFNVALFVPFGFMVRRVLEWPRWCVLLTGFATSLLIESTQFTGNWWTAPCPYRFADVTDLMTNTTGVVVGLLLEPLFPRFLSRKDELLGTKTHPRPVTRARRLLGMVLDAWYLFLVAFVTGGVVAMIYGLLHDPHLTNQQFVELQTWMVWTAWGAVMIAIVIPALRGHGASLGQRTVHLRSAAQGRGRLLMRALVVQGAVATLLVLGFPYLLWAFLLVAIDVWMVRKSPRGMSYAVAGLDVVDVRETAVSSESEESSTSMDGRK